MAQKMQKRKPTLKNKNDDKDARKRERKKEAMLGARLLLNRGEREFKKAP